MSFNYSPKIVTNGLILYVDAANTKSYVSGSTAWNDLSKSQFNGTLTNGPTFNTGSGGNIVFDGTNDYVDTTCSGISGTNPRTISVWFKPNILQNKNLFGYGTQAPLQMWDILLLSSGDMGVHLYNSQQEASTSYTVGVWQNIVYTFTYPTILSYMNGAFKNNYTNININTGTTSLVNIAKGTFAAYYYFNGSVGITQIYNQALSAAEILQNYNATKTRYGL